MRYIFLTLGLADPNALSIAVGAFQACQFLGYPECKVIILSLYFTLRDNSYDLQYNLSHCATYLARAPKSNESTAAYQKAVECINKHEGALPGVPLHLRNAPTQIMKELGQ